MASKATVRRTGETLWTGDQSKTSKIQTRLGSHGLLTAFRVIRIATSKDGAARDIRQSRKSGDQWREAARKSTTCAWAYMWA
jgi:hypothetical protein